MSATNVFNKLFCGMIAVGLVVGAFNAMATTPDCPDCPPELDGSIFPGGSCENCKDPSDLDGSIFPGGSCNNCSERKVSDKEVRIVEGTDRGNCPDCVMPVFATKNYPLAKPRYKSNAVNRDCCGLAPFTLKHVDFRLKDQKGYNPYTNHVGNYRFRIFGCRRESKKAMLNRGRVIQKDMMFQEIFKKAVDKCYKVIDIPDVCLNDQTVRLPEYVLTAEITNFFMNVCDEYDWDKARKANRRNGSAEMTVTWRLLNLSQSKVYWKGVTAGYADVEDGVYEGEVELAEAAFADAAARLSSLPGFEYQLAQRISVEDMNVERAKLVEFDMKFHPGKCVFEEEVAETQTCEYAPQPQCPAEPAPVVKTSVISTEVASTPVVAQEGCKCEEKLPCQCEEPNCECMKTTCVCTPTEPKVEEIVDVQTKTQTVEQKIITTTRIETPQVLCRQVCTPICRAGDFSNCSMDCKQECKEPECRKVCTKTCVDDKCTEECVEDCGKKQPLVEETGGVDVQNRTIAPQIEETGGVETSHRIYENCIDENGNVIADGSCTIIDDSWVDLEGYNVDAKLCIVDRPPYTELSPENMLKIRSSVVEISNAKGKTGMGLIISDSFVLTSAGLVNKLQNTYDVKTINGEVLKAKAVRVNPSKNTALMHLEKPVTYTPISLNIDLPAIDQEGFISLGLLGKGDSAKNYLDENGKIYGYRYSDTQGTEIIVDTLVQKVAVGSVLIDKLGTVNGISNSAKQTEDGMDLFLPTETALRSVGLTICEKLYEKKSPWQKTVYKPVTEKVKQEIVTPEAMPVKSRK